MTAQPARLFRHVEAGVGRPATSLAADDLAIAHSVLYASLFDYPLTLAQLRQTLIESLQTPSQILATYDRSHALQAVVEHRDAFFFVRGQRDLLEERRHREARSRAFLDRHRLLLTLVCAIPYVRMAALSGSIAHLNLEGEGDLDLFIVTRGRHVWSVTVAVLALAKLMRQRKTLCANYVIADSRLALEEQDLFTASQIVHLKPLVGRDVFRTFVSANPFVARFYPNFHEAGALPLPFRRAATFDCLKRMVETVFEGPSRTVEALCRRMYLAHLRRQASSWQSPDQVRLEDDCLKLHTRSHRRSVMDRYERAIRDAIG